LAVRLFCGQKRLSYYCPLIFRGPLHFGGAGYMDESPLTDLSVMSYVISDI